MEPTRAPPCAEAISTGMTLRGRHFAAEELLQIRALVQAAPPRAHRFAISKQVCEVLNWVEVGHMKEGARMDRHFKVKATKKTMFVYRLVKDAVRRLRA